jgi:cobaltochelatase CobS
MTSADLTSTKCLEIAARFGINVMDVISSVESPIETPKDIPVIETKEADNVTVAEKLPAITDDKTAAALAALQSLLSPSVDMATVKKIVAETVAKALEGTALVRIELKRVDNTEYKSDGTQHPLFADLLTSLSTKMANGAYPNVWIAGPTGSGKTHAAKECAKAFGVPFYFNGALGMAHELTGFVDAAGNYHTTPFRVAYEQGGVYLFDEVDASDNAALLALNAALANGECSFPDNPLPVARHENFRCIGAANTFGQGATAEFIGRAKIDAAILSRFAIKLHWTYDVALEQAISGNVEFTKRVQAARARAQAAGVKIVIDPRHSMAGAALISAGMSSDRAAALTYLAGLNSDQQRIVEGR